MSSAAYFKAKQPISLTDWLVFCDEQEIVYSPNTVGQNVFYYGAVEITFGPDRGTVERVDGRPVWDTARPPASATKVTISTYFMGSAMRDVARLACAIRGRFRGRLSADEEIRLRMRRVPSAV